MPPSLLMVKTGSGKDLDYHWWNQQVNKTIFYSFLN